MARRPISQQREFEALLDRFADEIRRAWVVSIEDIISNVRLMQLVNAIERAYVSASASMTAARTIAGMQFDRAVTLAGVAINTARVNTALAALNLEYEFFRPLEEAIRRTFIAGGDSGVKHLPPLRSGDGARVVIRFDVRNPEAEAFLQRHSSNLITRIVEEQRSVVRNVLVDGMARGQNPRQTALQLVGRLDRSTGKRTGGMIGLSGPQERTMSWVRQALAENDRDGLRKYLQLKTRDKRFDKMVLRAIDGERLSAESAERITSRLADRYLKLRGDTISRTESLTSLNAGRTEAFRQAIDKAGIDHTHVTRVWSSTVDGRTRDTHLMMNGQKVTGPNSPFRTPGGAMLMYPGDTSLGAPASETISCRCMVSIKVDYFEGRA